MIHEEPANLRSLIETTDSSSSEIKGIPPSQLLQDSIALNNKSGLASNASVYETESSNLFTSHEISKVFPSPKLVLAPQPPSRQGRPRTVPYPLPRLASPSSTHIIFLERI
jgi:hypothetical protein